MNLPERFDLSYIGEDNQKHRPVMIHRVVYGSLERFLGILIEHYAGKFPVWLAPVQVKLLTIADKHLDFVQQVARTLKAQGVRVGVDTRSEKIGYKIRQAQLEKVPYMAVVGDQEVTDNKLAVRTRDGQQLAFTVPEFAEKILKEIKGRV
jgi:threonyl-tRNA synthetase